MVWDEIGPDDIGPGMGGGGDGDIKFSTFCIDGAIF